MKSKNTSIIKRAAFAALAAAMLLSMTACGAKSSEEDSGEETLTDTAMNLLTQGGHSDESGKEETVYVISEANGSPSEIIDSVHLKNGDGSDALDDVADLADIENTKGDETYTDNGDGTITWNAGGSDIYYRGTSNASLPLNVSVSYTLDGNPVTADELAGKSGHLAITFSYDNTMTKQVKVGGEDVTISRPCAVVSGVLLENDTCSNVTVTNGKAVSDGDNIVAVGLAMPGLRESLGLDTLEDADEDKLEKADELMPDSVTIEADVTDFSLSMTLTAVSWDIMDSIDLTDLSDTVDDANDSAADLQDGADELISGAEELNSYLDELADGTGDLSDGAAELADGAADAKEGIDELNDGLVEMQSQVSALPEGAKKLLAGAQALSAALQSGSTANPGVYEAILMMKDGADQIASGTSSVMTGAQSLASGADMIASSLVSGDTTNPGIYEAASLAKTGLDGAVTDLGSSITAAAGGLSQSTAAEQAALQALDAIDTSSLPSGEMGLVNAVATAKALITGAYTADSQVLTGLSGASLDTTAIDTALDGIMTGAQSLAAGAQKISAGLVSGDAENPGIYEAAAALNSGAASLSENAAYLASVVATMNNSDNLGALVSGLQELCGSSDTLVSGVDQLASGSGQLSTGLGTLSDGADELADGATTVDTAAGELADGSQTLLDGINTLNDEGISKIVDLLGSDMTDLYDRLEALKDFGSETLTCSGVADGTDCSAIYIYKTASIG